MAGTAPRHSGHPIATAGYISNRDRTTPRSGSCGCGWSMTWLPQFNGGDPDQPFIDGYLEHRRAVKAGDPKVLGQGWVRLSLTEKGAA